MSIDELRSRCSRPWPAIAKAQSDADRQIVQIRKLMQEAADAEGSIDSEDITVVVFGSLARREWTYDSDVDWTLLIDGQADHGHAETGHRMATLSAVWMIPLYATT
jgi:predicted nucleotidyltransferase